MTRLRDEYATTKHNKIYKAIRKLIEAGCSFCPWHRIENAKRQPTHGDDKKVKPRDKK